MYILRILIAISLAVYVISCLYYGYIKILYYAINLAAYYDIYFLYVKLGVKRGTAVGIFLFMIFFNNYLMQIYNLNSYCVIKIVVITQTSDVYQFISGAYFGKNKIGWISKNKTYEGYIIGFIFTLITFMPLYYYKNGKSCFNTSIMEIFWIYFLGIISGLCSSLFKRIQNIKDYSNLLGPHGGWIDRIDSIILPSLFTAFPHVINLC